MKPNAFIKTFENEYVTNSQGPNDYFYFNLIWEKNEIRIKKCVLLKMNKCKWRKWVYFLKIVFLNLKSENRINKYSYCTLHNSHSVLLIIFQMHALFDCECLEWKFKCAIICTCNKWSCDATSSQGVVMMKKNEMKCSNSSSGSGSGSSNKQIVNKLCRMFEMRPHLMVNSR